MILRPAWPIGCKTGQPTLRNFDHAGAFIEHNLLALVTSRVGKKLQWATVRAILT